MAGTYGAEKTDCDSPVSLVDSTLKWIEANIKDSIDFVVWTGDSARHDSDEHFPRHDKSVQDSNRALADKIAETFSSPSGKLTIPIIPTFGNNDFLPHNIMYPGPNHWFAAYADIWRRFIPEEQRHSFEFGGWFHVDVIPGKLSVFSLNTMYFFDRNAAVDGCAKPSEPGYQHMEWLRVQLEIMRKMGTKAILIGHVPPARTQSKQNWDETCWQRYTLWLQKYRDVVVASLYGHMNIDHFLLSDTKEIELDSAANAAAQITTKRKSIDEISVQGKDDYLGELRSLWEGIPSSVEKILDDEEEEDLVSAGKKRKKHKFKKIGGKYAERYQLSLISPSVVPNYFPTIRVFEYNITGLENAAVWEDKPHVMEPPPLMTDAIAVADEEDDDDDDERPSLELRSVGTQKKGKKKGKKGGKGKKGKDKPRDPHLIVPDDPPEESLPGPAYYPQQFTLLGYTQYFANLTHLNNDHADEGEGEVKGYKWRDGNHGDKKPKHKHAQPREFHYEVEYSTFDDKHFKLKDLTVRNYLHLAYRMGKHGDRKGKSLDVQDERDDGIGNDNEEDGDSNVSINSNEKGGEASARGKQDLATLARLCICQDDPSG